MSEARRLLGQHVLTKWGPGGYRTTVPGRVISYTDKPTVTIEYPDGSRDDWLVELVEIVDPSTGGDQR